MTKKDRQKFRRIQDFVVKFFCQVKKIPNFFDPQDL